MYRMRALQRLHILHGRYEFAGVQNRMLALLIIIWIIPATASDIQNVWFSKWAIFEARKRNGVYNYKAPLAVLMIAEDP